MLKKSVQEKGSVRGRKAVYTYKTKEFGDLINNVFPVKHHDSLKMFKSLTTLYFRIKHPDKFLVKEIVDIAALAGMEPETVFSVIKKEAELKSSTDTGKKSK